MIKATITLSKPGFVSVSDAIAVGEVKQNSIKGGEWDGPFCFHIDWH